MPTIIIQANHTERATFCERIVAEHLRDGHYAAQLIERLRWAAGDAEALERTDDADLGDDFGAFGRADAGAAFEEVGRSEAVEVYAG